MALFLQEADLILLSSSSDGSSRVFENRNSFTANNLLYRWVLLLALQMGGFGRPNQERLY